MHLLSEAPRPDHTAQPCSWQPSHPSPLRTSIYHLPIWYTTYLLVVLFIYCPYISSDKDLCLLFTVVAPRPTQYLEYRQMPINVSFLNERVRLMHGGAEEDISSLPPTPCPAPGKGKALICMPGLCSPNS